VELLDAPTGRWPCIVASGEDWPLVVAHAAPGAGVGLRVSTEQLDDSALLNWLDEQSVRGRTGPEHGADGDFWLFGVLAGRAIQG
jgi:hypothetical protein